jgi:hypothetical protein
VNDNVDHPAHYNQGSVETIEAIKAAIGPAFPDYCVGNAIKYLFRWRHKGGPEDLKKARWYIERAIQETAPFEPLP